MGQALEMCIQCENRRGCDNCTDLHNWIMEHLDSEPVKHGEWVFDDFVSPTLICSECRKLAGWDGDYFAERSNYCPHCGAKMADKEPTLGYWELKKNE